MAFHACGSGNTVDSVAGALTVTLAFGGCFGCGSGAVFTWPILASARLLTHSIGQRRLLTHSIVRNLAHAGLQSLD